MYKTIQDETKLENKIDTFLLRKNFDMQMHERSESKSSGVNTKPMRMFYKDKLVTIF